uniref:NADH-ubiquinone oxidoreductase chain 5 n=1 Tax=Agrilus discalis TaxID=3013958 RepID=A0A9E9FY86_9COLE|nr:NADH dehydrogenase subunit 5 [Agrilus discalis]WAP90838.1 NADH dehydrogenase subunit 5 [Agrilus discalis]
MINICLIYSVIFLFFSVSLFLTGLNFLVTDLVYFIELNLISLNSSSIVMVLLLDWMSLFFMSFVLFISSMVIYYSSEYMHGDLKLNRFINLICLFVLSMMLLIISPNLISILLGWDGLGLVSYCLVIYYQNVKSSSAGMLTAISNRVGDVAILMSIAWMMNYGSWNYIFYLSCMKNDYSMKFISFLVVLAALTKSAQIPFSSWLPAAMAAPTPVSSLVHSSTLVTAGVYLVIRFFNCFNETLLFLLLFLGCFTMFMAGLGANFEFDLKKIIALSTLSQLGLMMSIIALGEPILGFFHLLTHALFKALLFMCAGCMIHSLMDCQDIRYMGSMSVFMPLTCSLFNVSNLALSGMPFLAGFYSKDLILEVVSLSYLNIFMYFIFFISTGLTFSYTIRLLFFTVFGNLNFYSLNLIKDDGFVMMKGMMGLIFLVIFGGSALSWLMFPFPYFISLPLLMKCLTLMVILLGGWLGYYVSQLEIGSSSLFLGNMKSSLFLSLMWNMPFLSTYFLNYPTLFLGNFYFKYLDQGWFEYAGSQNLYNNLMFNSSFMLKFSKLSLKIFMMMTLFWVIFLVFYYF